MTVFTMPLSARAADAFRYMDEVDSTNVRLRSWCRGDAEGSAFMAALAGPASAATAAPTIGMLAAGAQTAGHGRLGRAWTDREGESFVASFLVPLPRALVYGAASGWLTMAAGLAALAGLHDALPGDALDARPELKWPNDVYCGGRKLGGILTEAQDLPDGRVGFVVGIGLNLAMDAAALPTPESTALNLHVAGGQAGALPDFAVLRDRIGAGIVRALRRELEPLAEAAAARDGRRLADAVHAMRERYVAACWTLHRPVEARLTDGTVVSGVAEDVADDAALIVRDAHGERIAVRTGDVGVLPVDGVDESDGNAGNDTNDGEGNA
ncbi:biotin-(acetyl-CoA carboxylase) ligase [Bifidobacterium sp. DSM 109958]|uniref:biotin--[biotin carboxyl-carrier protein] ligase n=1 Tax=Bifidobacterium moraviense TaxID=2675323 RepID=A0A7Y0F3G7_9BIFI|nr:biotin--[acetyl-CoA-carboxylase] ligase [Bifidobacterium sp. DSM 109958]NMN01303.1 biotin-(acetyl-CoA carboxylase) ligase [Bifidobacterium sp. DSM 109958]